MVIAPLHGFDPTRPPDFSDALVRGRLSLAYTLFDGTRGPTRSAARAGTRAAIARQEATEAEVIQAVVEAYSAVTTATLVLDASLRQQGALTAELARADSAYAAGAAPRVETLRARAALAQADAEHGAALANLDASRSILASLVGRETAPRSLAELSPPTDVTRSDEPGLNPRVASARAAIESADAAHRAARGSLLPRVDLATGLDQFGAIDEAFSHEWQVGVRISAPIFLGGARYALIRQRAGEADAARAGLEDLELTLAIERARARSAFAAAQARVAALISAEEQFVEVVRIEGLALTEGSGIQRDLLAAEASLFRVRADLARARAAAVSAHVALAKTDGLLTQQWVSEHLEVSP